MITIQLEDERDYLLYRVASGDTVEIFDIQVGSGRRKGKGSTLIRNLLRQVPKDVRLVWAITRASNLIAATFYEKLGFRVIGTLRDFYGTKDAEGKDTVDAIMYGKALD